MSKKAEVAYIVHEYKIYEGGSGLELGYVLQFPKKNLRTFSQIIQYATVMYD